MSFCLHVFPLHSYSFCLLMFDIPFFTFLITLPLNYSSSSLFVAYFASGCDICSSIRSLFLSLSVSLGSHYYPLSINLQNLISGWMRLRSPPPTPPKTILHQSVFHLLLLLPPTHKERKRRGDFSPLSAFCNYISAVLHFAGHSPPPSRTSSPPSLSTCCCWLGCCF